MGKTKIEWTNKTWNPVTGCTPISPGCAHCYARRMAKRLAGRCGYPAAPYEFDVTLHPDRLAEPLRWRDPARVFACSMSDLFHDDVPFQFVVDIFAIMVLAHQHTFQVLTKRPNRMRYILAQDKWFWSYVAERAIAFAKSSGTYVHWDKVGFPLKNGIPNVWLGVTAENQEQAKARIPLLLQIPASVRFVSIEPMLGPVDLSYWIRCKWDTDGDGNCAWHRDGCPKLSWVICGGETGPGARPFDVMWARNLRAQCEAAGVPFFYKGAGTAQYRKDDTQYRKLDGREWNEFPGDVK